MGVCARVSTFYSEACVERMCKERQQLQAEPTMLFGQQPLDTYCIPDAVLGVHCSSRSSQEEAISLAGFVLAKLMKFGRSWFLKTNNKEEGRRINQEGES